MSKPHRRRAPRRTDTLLLTIQPTENGFCVFSEDMPTLNLFVKELHRLHAAVAKALRYLYRHNENAEIERLLLEIPVADQPSDICAEREVQIALAA